MKLTTEVWAKFESKGKPADTLKINGTTREIIEKLIPWLAKIYMGSYIRITIARDEYDLVQATEAAKKLVDKTMGVDLESVLLEQGISLDDFVDGEE